MLTMQALLCAAFLPSVSSGRAYAPAVVLDELARHRLDPTRSVHFIATGTAATSEGGATAHLSQAHLTAAFRPCGELQQAIISKARVNVNGAMALQTSVILSFKSAEGAILALRLAGMRGSVGVPMYNETKQLVGTAKLSSPQYACRLKFDRPTHLYPSDAPALPGPKFAEKFAEPERAGTADDSGGSADLSADIAEIAEIVSLPVELNWHSASALVSSEEAMRDERFLLAFSW